MSYPTIGAHVFSSDGHDLGTVREVTTAELLVTSGGLIKHTLSFRLTDVSRVTPDRVDLALDNAAIVHGTWNVVTLRDERGHDQHITQVGVPPTHTVPTYDEEQTTTGGPPTGEADR